MENYRKKDFRPGKHVGTIPRFRDADLTKADLRGCDLKGNDLTNAQLNSTNLYGTRLDGCAGVQVYNVPGLKTIYLQERDGEQWIKMPNIYMPLREALIGDLCPIARVHGQGSMYHLFAALLWKAVKTAELAQKVSESIAR